MALLPVAFGLAILALLVILRKERHLREEGQAVTRPLHIRPTLALFGLLAVVYVTVYVVSVLRP